MANKSSFDLDFGYGRKGEQLVEELLTGGKTVEVKRDRKWWITNNLYIEVECWFNKSKSWEPSGLSVTEAAYWAFVLEQSVLIVPTHILKKGVAELGREISCEIPPNKSKGYLITVEDLLTMSNKVSSSQFTNSSSNYNANLITYNEVWNSDTNNDGNINYLDGWQFPYQKTSKLRL